MKRLRVPACPLTTSRTPFSFTARFLPSQTDCNEARLYAKSMMDNAVSTFAISTRGERTTSWDVFGIQVETPDELHEVYGRLQQADRPCCEEGVTTCCYAKLSEKAWIKNPQGLSWEALLTFGESTVYGTNVDLDHPPANRRGPAARPRPTPRLPLPPAAHRNANGGMTDRAFNVLFLCTGNSARSIIAGGASLQEARSGALQRLLSGQPSQGAVNPLALKTILESWLFD